MKRDVNVFFYDLRYVENTALVTINYVVIKHEK